MTQSHDVYMDYITSIYPKSQAPSLPAQLHGRSRQRPRRIRRHRIHLQMGNVKSVVLFLSPLSAQLMLFLTLLFH